MATTPSGQVVPNAPITGWKIVGQQETTDIGPDGKAGPGVRVDFDLDNIGRFSVFLPRSQYTPTNVQAAIAAYAAQLRDTHRLSG